MTLAKQAIVVDNDGDESDGEGIIFTPCCIKHYTLDSPDKVQDYTNSGNTGKITAEEKDTAQYWRWIILNTIQSMKLRCHQGKSHRKTVTQEKSSVM